MNTATKITTLAASFAVVVGAAYALGAVVGPVAAEVDPAGHLPHKPSEGHAHGHQAGAHEGPPTGGLQTSDGGYTLDLKTPRLDVDRRAELRFAIRDSDGQPLNEYRTVHDKELHLILASRDLSTYLHLHPTRAADGTWSTPVTLPEAGDYRAIADFTPAAEGSKNFTLGADLAASGTHRPKALPAPSRTAEVDGYTVTLDGRLRPGSAQELTLTVSKHGRAVTDLQPYRGAYGHLVALRSGDLAYLHVHPHGAPGDGTTRPGPDISFTATAPSAGAYRLFLDFQHKGTVRTAAFTVHAAESGEGPTEAAGETESGDHQH
ncbi:hypothetical protein ACFYO0_44705 [Streptomyces sp. NPDC006365]|uniref:hypothetical protein n=1 Tax=Streptomyces sp. NPDC006365 TaxID=3364744 RepID=UPI003688B9CC